MEKVCVAVRVRPAMEDSRDGTFLKVEDNRISLPGASYTFDHVFDQACSNATVYELAVKPIITAALQGLNGTTFAYGQTSSGKTFTMTGTQDDPGIIQRAAIDIFQKIKMKTNREFQIRVSYMEIYNKDINDLLSVENKKMHIRESLDRGVFVAGLREESVSNSEQVLELIQRGEVNRHLGETDMNIGSSRSHAIFRMLIESKGIANPNDAVRVSVLNLVDLAGSERSAKAGATGVRLEEGKHINESLMMLGHVISKLSEGKKQRSRGHIPYRNSKLTWILQHALGGNAKTSIICTLAPEEVHIEESKGTLQFASRAKQVTNCVQVNEILTDAALVERQKHEIEELRVKLQVIVIEREKLSTELEEERKLRKEHEQCIIEQRQKIHNLSNLASLSDSTQGSHSVVLEEEVVKLRNDLLKCEIEREKLSTELEGERRLQMEQKEKIENFSNILASISDSIGHATQDCTVGGESLKRRKSMIHLRRKRRIDKARSIAYQRADKHARRFMTNPFVIYIMQSSSISGMLRVRGSFIREHFGEKCDSLTLVVAGSGAWVIKCIPGSRDAVGFSGGWRKFLRENELKVGDVCIYEVSKSSDQPVLDVTIFRAAED